MPSTSENATLRDHAGAEIPERVRWMCRRVVGEDILDAGCGDGAATGILAADGHRLLAIDSSKDAISRTLELLGRQGLTVSDTLCVVRAPVTDIPSEAATIDTVLFGEVLNELVDPVPALREAARVLRPGGRMIVTCRYGTGTDAQGRRGVMLGELIEIVGMNFTVRDAVLIDGSVGVVAERATPPELPDEALARALAVAERRVVELTAQLDEARIEQDQPVRELQVRLHDAEATIAQLRTRAEAAAAHGARATALEEHVAGQQAMIADLQQQATRYAERAAALQALNDDLAQRQARAEEQRLAQNSAELRASRGQEQELQHLRSELDVAIRQRDEHSEATLAARLERDELRQDVGRLGTLGEHLENKLRELGKRADLERTSLEAQLQSERSDADQRHAALQQQLEQAMAEAREQRVSLTLQLERATVEARKQRATLGMFERAAIDEKGQRAGLETQLRRAKRQLKRSDKELARARKSLHLLESSRSVRAIRCMWRTRQRLTPSRRSRPELPPPAK